MCTFNFITKYYLEASGNADLILNILNTDWFKSYERVSYKFSVNFLRKICVVGNFDA